MAATKPPYDPVKTVEGMFNGSVTRIAYAMKDPQNFAQSTRAVLAETAKKFQDALDDCEIRILDAKWHLENQLALNRTRRETKAREDSAANAKRKRDEIKDGHEKVQGNERENAAKRVRTAEPEEITQSQQKMEAVIPQQAPAAGLVAKETTSLPPPKPVAKPAGKPTAKPPGPKPAGPKPADKPKVFVTTDVRASQRPSAPLPKARERPPESALMPESTLTQTTSDEFPKITPQDTPAAGNEDFNFVSMFGDASGDMMDGVGNDMSFDLNLGDGFDAEAANMNMNDSSLTSLLPGLESYANQAGEDNGFNLGGTINMGNAMLSDLGGGPISDMNTQQTINPNDFSLPALGPNEFDEFLNSNDMNFDDPLNMEDDGLMSMENMENMDFDSMFK